MRIVIRLGIICTHTKSCSIPNCVPIMIVSVKYLIVPLNNWWHFNWILWNYVHVSKLFTNKNTNTTSHYRLINVTWLVSIVLQKKFIVYICLAYMQPTLHECKEVDIKLRRESTYDFLINIVKTVLIFL